MLPVIDHPEKKRLAYQILKISAFRKQSEKVKSRNFSVKVGRSANPGVMGVGEGVKNREETPSHPTPPHP